MKIFLLVKELSKVYKSTLSIRLLNERLLKKKTITLLELVPNGSMKIEFTAAANSCSSASDLNRSAAALASSSNCF